MFDWVSHWSPGIGCTHKPFSFRRKKKVWGCNHKSRSWEQPILQLHRSKLMLWDSLINLYITKLWHFHKFRIVSHSQGSSGMRLINQPQWACYWFGWEQLLGYSYIPRPFLLITRWGWEVWEHGGALVVYTSMSEYHYVTWVRMWGSRIHNNPSCYSTKVVWNIAVQCDGVHGCCHNTTNENNCRDTKTIAKITFVFVRQQAFPYPPFPLCFCVL